MLSVAHLLIASVFVKMANALGHIIWYVYWPKGMQGSILSLMVGLKSVAHA